MTDSTTRLRHFIDCQLNAWPMAAQNYEALNHVHTRHIRVGGGYVKLQHNPARAISTGASLKSSDIAARPCFLCTANRPKAQLTFGKADGYEILLNPFPIFSVHLTISSLTHERQTSDLPAMFRFALAHPGLAAFYNGARSGASAPDHRHFQAAPEADIPLLGMIGAEAPRIVAPYGVGAYVTDVSSDAEASRLEEICGIDPDTDHSDQTLKNVLCHALPDGRVRFVIIPRRRHRPEQYFAEGANRIMVSPGAIDVAGLIITPRESDFNNITAADMKDVFAQTTFSAAELEQTHRFKA